MSSTENPTINAFLRHNRVKALATTDIRRISVFGEKKSLTVKPFSQKSNVQRHVVSTGEKFQRRAFEPFIGKKSMIREQISLSDRNVINYKSACFASRTKNRIGSTVDVKVGMFGSQSRLGQTVQAIGSIAIPGDTSEIRSPIRSRLYSALTPGGGGRRGIMGRQERGYRCPAGFEHGGRFTDSRFSTCGAQLFGIPNLGRLIGSPRGGARDVAEARADRVSETVTGMTPQERAIQIQRMAQIPRSGAENPRKRFAVTVEAIKSLSGAPAGEGRLIRKDGVMLRPLVPSSVLRNFGGNPDMENANFVRVIGKPNDIVGDDLALLAGPAVRQITYVTSNGSTLSIERQRDLTVGERRKFGRQLNRVAGTSDKYDVGNTIRDFASNSNGAFNYSEKFPNIPKPLELIEVEDDKGRKINVRRWVYETFMRDGGGKPSGDKIRRETATAIEDDTSGNETSNDLAEAVKILDDGGDPMDISPEFIEKALSRSKRYTSKKLKSGVTEWTDGSDKSLLQIPERRNFGAVAEKTYRDVSSYFGVKNPAMKIGGTPDKRFVVSRDAASLGGKQDFDAPLSSVNKKDLLSVAVSDFLLDARDRSPANLTPTKIGDDLTVIPSSNDLSAGAGLSASELNKRRAFDLPDYWTARQRRVFGAGFTDSEKVREALVQHLQNLIERAKKFNWNEYSSRFASDGQLSDAEKTHLTVIKKIFDARLATLAKSKESFLNTLGI